MVIKDTTVFQAFFFIPGWLECRNQCTDFLRKWNIFPNFFPTSWLTACIKVIGFLYVDFFYPATLTKVFIDSEVFVVVSMEFIHIGIFECLLQIGIVECLPFY